MLRKNIETFLSCGNEWQEAGTVLFGAPFDSTTSYRPGLAAAPSGGSPTALRATAPTRTRT